LVCTTAVWPISPSENQPLTRRKISKPVPNPRSQVKTAVKGNVSYKRLDIELDHLTEDGQRKASWETERTIEDPTEFEEATKIRDQARALITGVCARSAFGLLCPERDEAELDRATAAAERLADKFNADAELTRVDVRIIKGRIAADDVTAMKAINGEVQDLLTRMETGMRNLDVSMVRDAADRARNLGRMLSPAAQDRIQDVVDVVRREARRIVKAGEQAAIEIDQATLSRITAARTAFLDLEPAPEVAAPAEEARAIEFEPEKPAPGKPAPEIKSAPATAPRLIEME
jgi:hypothetical protein